MQYLNYSILGRFYLILKVHNDLPQIDRSTLLNLALRHIWHSLFIMKSDLFPCKMSGNIKNSINDREKYRVFIDYRSRHETLNEYGLPNDTPSASCFFSKQKEVWLTNFSTFAYNEKSFHNISAANESFARILRCSGSDLEEKKVLYEVCVTRVRRE